MSTPTQSWLWYQGIRGIRLSYVIEGVGHERIVLSERPLSFLIIHLDSCRLLFWNTMVSSFKLPFVYDHVKTSYGSDMVKQRTDRELAAAVQAAVNCMLPQIVNHSFEGVQLMLLVARWKFLHQSLFLPGWIALTRKSPGELMMLARKLLEILRDRDDYDRPERSDKRNLVLARTNGTGSQQSTELPTLVPANNKASRGYTYPVCTTCGRRHPGECRRAAGTCFKCGQAGHLQRDCKKNTGGISSSGYADKKPDASGRVFALTQDQAANATGFLANIHDTTSDVSSIHDQPIVSEFQDVFPEELPGIPPIRDVEFNIESFQEQNQIPRAPYRMAPMSHIVSSEGDYHGSAKVEAIISGQRPDISGLTSEMKRFERAEAAFVSAYPFLSIRFSLNLMRLTILTMGLELAALSSLLKSGRHYFMAIHVTFHDHKSSSTFSTSENPNMRQRRWKSGMIAGIKIRKKRLFVIGSSWTIRVMSFMDRMCFWARLKIEPLNFSLCVPEDPALRELVRKFKIEIQRVASGVTTPIRDSVWKWDEISMDFRYRIFFISRLAESSIARNRSIHGTPSANVSDRDLYGQSERTIQTLEDMLRSCALEWTGNWDDYICLVEFAYNNSWHASIKCAPFEMLYGRKCRAPICWDQVGERVLEGPEMIEVTNEKVVVAREKLKEAQTRQKSYADKHRRSLEFQPGEHVFLKVSYTMESAVFWLLRARLVLVQVIIRQLHVSLIHLVSSVKSLSYTEEPESILDRQVRVMRNKTIPFVKILWRNHPEREATWETEESIRTSYPHFLP
ncbi:putative nucleotidyltransferase, ribonuclease H [Tanacetum coccineum]|uniref:Nucleotidyltransferase, ribonuclease H n=1 Tax=Tanacetum coccineum TaxID=301880 RepID=A0ABQ4WNH9_9ASTR